MKNARSQVSLLQTLRKGRDYVLCCTIGLAQGWANALGLYRIYTYRMNDKINTVMPLGAARMLSRKFTYV